MATDVLVAGGGPAGLAAAAAAARQGAATMLVERYGFLGGMATAGLVNPFMAWHIGGEPLVGGIFQEMLDRMAAAGGRPPPSIRRPSSSRPMISAARRESGFGCIRF